jgi:drug/metabolite transporter (DMT)-like permease
MAIIGACVFSSISQIYIQKVGSSVKSSTLSTYLGLTISVLSLPSLFLIESEKLSASTEIAPLAILSALGCAVIGYFYQEIYQLTFQLKQSEQQTIGFYLCTFLVTLALVFILEEQTAWG